MSQKKIAVVTCSTKPDVAADDLLAVDALRTAGANVQATPWDDPRIDWTAFDRVVLRSCWNYHQHPAAFGRWLDELERKQVAVANPVKVVQWNVHKSYLGKLAETGVLIPDTEWVLMNSGCNLADLLKAKEWPKAVVKPAISATAYNTFAVEPASAPLLQGRFDALNTTSDLLVQKFLLEVQEEGEWSLLFFDKQFSHAVLKKAAANDFRVQNDFGGTYTVATAPEFAVHQAGKILSGVPERLLYARVDGIVSGGKFVLMELELIEPVLFLAQKDGAAARFAALTIE